MQTVDDKTVISGLRWYTSDQYGLLITVGDVGGVGGDLSQTVNEQQTEHVKDLTTVLVAIFFCFSLSIVA